MDTQKSRKMEGKDQKKEKPHTSKAPSFQAPAQKKALNTVEGQRLF